MGNLHHNLRRNLKPSTQPDLHLLRNATTHWVNAARNLEGHGVGLKGVSVYIVCYHVDFRQLGKKLISEQSFPFMSVGHYVYVYKC